MEASRSVLRVLIIEDDALVTAGLKAVLSSSGGLEVVGACASGAELAEWLTGERRLDVALVDLGLPDVSGTELIRQLSASFPEAAVVAFTQYDDPDHVFDALRAGAVGYLLKSTAGEKVPGLLHEAVRGGSPLSPSVARRIVGAFSATEKQPLLTARERTVLELLVDGASYGDVAAELDVEMSTVQTHVKNLYRKLRVSSRAGAEERARQWGVLPKRSS